MMLHYPQHECTMEVDHALRLRFTNLLECIKQEETNAVTATAHLMSQHENEQKAKIYFEIIKTLALLNKNTRELLHLRPYMGYSCLKCRETYEKFCENKMLILFGRWHEILTIAFEGNNVLLMNLINTMKWLINNRLGLQCNVYKQIYFKQNPPLSHVWFDMKRRENFVFVSLFLSKWFPNNWLQINPSIEILFLISISIYVHWDSCMCV